jgi:hypothetical protein
MYSLEEQADPLIQQLLLDKGVFVCVHLFVYFFISFLTLFSSDPILRYGAMYTIGLAYAGTANNT